MTGSNNGYCTYPTPKLALDIRTELRHCITVPTFKTSLGNCTGGSLQQRDHAPNVSTFPFVNTLAATNNFSSDRTSCRHQLRTRTLLPNLTANERMQACATPALLLSTVVAASSNCGPLALAYQVPGPSNAFYVRSQRTSKIIGPTLKSTATHEETKDRTPLSMCIDGCVANIV